MKIPSLLQDYKKFEKLAKKYDGVSESLDTSSEYFLGPATIVPLLCFAETNNIHEIITHHNTYDFVNRVLNHRETSTTKPFVNLPKTKKEFIENRSATEVAEKINSDYGGYYAIHDICSELIGNIYNHTPMEKGYAHQGYSFAQEYYNAKKLDICVMDDGLSIPGKFEEKNKSFIDDCDAISQAIIPGVTTAKDEETDIRYSRGHGLSTILSLVIDGNNGEALIVSRQGCLHITNDDYKYILLDNKDIFKGTLITLRLNKNPIENYYDILELTSVRSKFKYEI